MTDYPSVDTPITFTDGACATSIINVTDVFNVSDVNIIDLEGDYPDMSEVTVTLTSPQGTVVTLFDGLCAGTDDWDINLDDQATDSQASITCNPLGGGATFQPLQSLSVLYGEAAFGDWALDVYATGDGDGELTTWTNCEAGSITVEYIFLDENAVILNTPIAIEAGSLASEFFAVGTTQVIYTLIDGAGNTSQCGFDVTVLDTENPDLSGVFAASGLCQDITLQVEAGSCEAALPGYGDAFPLAPNGSTDNCGIVEVTYDPPRD